MSTFTWYTHEDPEEVKELAEYAAANTTDVSAHRIIEIINRAPLYEVRFDFDVDSGKCVAVRVEGETFTKETR